MPVESACCGSARRPVSRIIYGCPGRREGVEQPDPPAIAGSETAVTSRRGDDGLMHARNLFLLVMFSGVKDHLLAAGHS